MMLSWLCHCTLHAALPCPVYQLVQLVLCRLSLLTECRPTCASTACTLRLPLHCLNTPLRLPTTL